MSAPPEVSPPCLPTIGSSFVMLRMCVDLLLFQILFRKYKMFDNSLLISILECMQKLPQVFTVGSSDSDCPCVKCMGWMVSLTPFFSGDCVGMCFTTVKKYCGPASFRGAQLKSAWCHHPRSEGQCPKCDRIGLAGPSIYRYFAVVQYPLWGGKTAAQRVPSLRVHSAFDN